MNQDYFNLLLDNAKDQNKSLSLFCPENRVNGEIIPLTYVGNEDLKKVNFFNFNEIVNEEKSNSISFNIRVVKMQGGLGSSVKRADVIKMHEGRTILGSKGTDLFYPTKEFGAISISNLQLLQTAKLKNNKNVSKVKFQFLVNDETHDVVMNSFKSLNDYLLPEILAPIVQKKMPTLDESNILTNERKAPAGHGFIAYKEVYDAITSDSSEIVCIGNGEDLNSTPDLKNF